MDQSIILLTYKGKVLLMQKDHILATVEQQPWHFISGVKGKNESCEQTIQREVEKVTSIQLGTIDFLGSDTGEGEKKHFYHTRLTDDNVNKIVRQSGKVVGFFSLKEVDKLLLSLTAQLLITRYKYLLTDANQL
jgi:hypothetical protein